MLVPATQSNVELCKLVISAHILDYPAPVLVNWNRTTDYNRPEWRVNGTHIDKLAGIDRYLNAHATEFEADLFLVLDGYDTWFQLPASVLLARYHRINAVYTKYIAAIVGEDTARNENLRQRIIFPSQKECGPKDSGHLSMDDPGCYAVPPSPLPHDLYGPKTDIDDTKWPWHVRSRWVNSGLIIGPLPEMRAMYGAASALIDTFDHGGSDQLIFSKLFGEQWYQRHVMSEGPDSLSLTMIPAALASSVAHDRKLQPMPRLEGHPLELSIGLDYAMELSHSQVFSETDARFLVFNDSQSLADQQELTGKELGMGYGKTSPRATLPMAADVAGSRSPFSKISAKTKGDTQNDSWNQIPLYTNIYTGNIPVTIHMNGMKEMRQQLWPRVWYHNRLRELFKAELQRREVGAYDEEGNFMPWSQLCGSSEEQVFSTG